ncbi:MAG: hypothetical protein AAGG53_03430 [Cyanobacteria bacterium P01_H01_bin.152]
MPPATAYPGCLLQPQLESDRPHRYPCCSLRHHRGDWVKLLQGPHGSSSRRAQLLFSESLSTWIAKIPYHGEIVLDRSQFYC